MIELNPFGACCGVAELQDISFCGKFDMSGFESQLDDITSYSHIIFTQATNKKNMKKEYGEDLAKLIRRHHLGRVQRSHPSPNPQTGNTITTFTWTVNKKGVENYLAKLNDDDDDDE